MIHSFKLNGYNIVLDTASGSVHSVDDVAYDIIGMFESAGEDEIVRDITARYGGVYPNPATVKEAPAKN